MVLSLVPAYAQAQLVVTSAQPDTVNHVLVIQGGPFAAGLRVFLAPTFAELTVNSVAAGSVHATLPDSPAGTHLLVLYQPSTNQLATFPVTIGAVGPTGPDWAARPCRTERSDRSGRRHGIRQDHRDRRARQGPLEPDGGGRPGGTSWCPGRDRRIRTRRPARTDRSSRTSGTWRSVHGRGPFCVHGRR